MRVAISGCGRMGRRHIEAVKGLGFDVVGIFDLLPAALETTVIEQKIPRERCFESFSEMLNKTKPEGVVIATTAPGHAEQVIAAANAGVKYILCEKPMAVSLKECDDMMSVCKSRGAHLAVNHQMRYMDQYTVVKDLVTKAEFGGLSSITVAGANFGLAMNASHYFEMFRYMAGEEISEIQFWADKEKLPNPRGAQYEDHSGQVRATSATGKRLYIELGYDLGLGLQVIYGCKLGQIYVDELAGYLRGFYRKEEFRQLPSTRYGMPADEIVKQIAPADVIVPTQKLWNSMLEKHDFPDGACGRHTLACLVAAHESMLSNGQAVRLSEFRTHDKKFPWA